MTLDDYNRLCKQWHSEDTGQRLGQWLMNHQTDIEDAQIFYLKDKSEASTLFFNRYVVTSPNGVAGTISQSVFINHQPY